MWYNLFFLTWIFLISISWLNCGFPATLPPSLLSDFSFDIIVIYENKILSNPKSKRRKRGCQCQTQNMPYFYSFKLRMRLKNKTTGKYKKYILSVCLRIPTYSIYICHIHWFTMEKSYEDSLNKSSTLLQFRCNIIMSVMTEFTCHPQECGRPLLDLHQHRAPHRADSCPVRGARHRPGLCPALKRASCLVCKPLQGLFTNDGGYQNLTAQPLYSDFHF